MKRLLVILILVAFVVTPVFAQDDGEDDGVLIPEDWQEYLSEDEMVSFFYPTDWFADEIAPYYIASNSENLIEAANFGQSYDLQSGEIGVLMYFQPFSLYEESIEGLVEMEVADWVLAIAQLEAEAENTTFGEVSLYPVEEGEEPEFIGGGLTYQTEKEEGTYSIVVSVEDPEVVIIGMIAFAPGEMSADDISPFLILDTLEWEYSVEDVQELWAALGGEEEASE